MHSLQAPVGCQLAPEARGTQSPGELLARRSGSSEQELAEACGQEGLLSLTDIWPLHFRGHSSAPPHPSLRVALMASQERDMPPFQGSLCPLYRGVSPAVLSSLQLRRPHQAVDPWSPGTVSAPPDPRVREGFPRGAAWKLRIEI